MILHLLKHDQRTRQPMPWTWLSALILPRLYQDRKEVV